MAEYNPLIIEKKWQDYWEQNKTFELKNVSNKKFYCLDMFPYPSGTGLHIGHPLGYTATDIISRYKRHQGYSVLHPMGFDAFGLPTEQSAISTGEEPAEITRKNSINFKRQLKSFGFSYDWSREFSTTDEDYYKWTQWIFIKLYNSWFDEVTQKTYPIEKLPIPEEIKQKGELAIQEYQSQYRLAYYADADVNWCPALGTVLANEEVINGKSERGGFDVIRMPMKQWLLRITKYAERLLNDLDGLDWPENIKEQQRHWIGKSLGVEISFKVEHKDIYLSAFTMHPEMLFGVTFFVVAPEHPLLPSLIKKDFAKKIEAYCENSSKMSELTRRLENRKKSGAFTGSYVINPITREPIPVFVGDYILGSYAQGAVMGVPAHDERDFEFARTYQLNIRPVIIPDDTDKDVIEAIKEGEIPWTKSGVMLENEFPAALVLNIAGLADREAAGLVAKWLEKRGVGKVVVNFKLRDWLFSRQRYWGEPIPIIHWEDGTISTVDEKELPLKLPKITEYKVNNDLGVSPLANDIEWVAVKDQNSDKTGRRETNTMPQWAGSSWYYLRFLDPKNNSEPWNKELEKEWLPVDLYVGGAEHAVLHLLYARFWHKVLYDLGYVFTTEPFQKLFNQGMMLAYAYKDKKGTLVSSAEVEEGEDGVARSASTGEVLERIVAKMSKSLRNVVNPDEVIARYGADTVRMYLMFMGPLDCSRVWDSQAIIGNYRFLKKIWNIYCGFLEKDIDPRDKRELIAKEQEQEEIDKGINICIKKVTESLDAMQFNIAISAMMEFVSLLSKYNVSKETLEKFIVLLSPFAPHMSEELWQKLGCTDSISNQMWPKHNCKVLIEEKIIIAIQVNGKKRGTVEVDIEISDDQLKKIAIAALSNTQYAVFENDKFMVVRHPETLAPRVVNIVSI